MELQSANIPFTIYIGMGVGIIGIGMPEDNEFKLGTISLEI